MIAKVCSLRNPGDIASTGRNHGLEGQDISPVSQLLLNTQGGEAACQTELNVSSWHKADKSRRVPFVRFQGEADIRLSRALRRAAIEQAGDALHPRRRPGAEHPATRLVAKRNHPLGESKRTNGHQNGRQPVTKGRH